MNGAGGGDPEGADEPIPATLEADEWAAEKRSFGPSPVGLVTGAAGFIGSHLCERLLATGWSVVGLDSFSDYYDPGAKHANADRLRAESSAFELVAGDLAGDFGRTGLQQLLDRVDVVFHLAGRPGVRSSWRSEFRAYVEENIAATHALLEACVLARPRRIVVASSSSVYGELAGDSAHETDEPRPISPYGVTKLAAERLALAYAASFDLSVIALRYFTVFGPRQRPDMAFARFIESALSGRALPILGDGRQRRDFTFVGDVVTATLAAASAEVESGVINVAGGADASPLDVVELLSELLDTPVAAEHRRAAAGEPRLTRADVQRAEALLGFRPSTGLRDGLRQQLEASVAARVSPAQ